MNLVKIIPLGECPHERAKHERWSMLLVKDALGNEHPILVNDKILSELFNECGEARQASIKADNPVQ